MLGTFSLTDDSRFMENTAAVLIALCVYVLICGAVGTYVSLSRARSASERRLVLRAKVWILLGVSAFLGLLLLFPNEWRWLASLVYAVLVPFALRYVNRRQAALREEGRNA